MLGIRNTLVVLGRQRCMQPRCLARYVLWHCNPTALRIGSYLDVKIYIKTWRSFHIVSCPAEVIVFGCTWHLYIISMSRATCLCVCCRLQKCHCTATNCFQLAQSSWNSFNVPGTAEDCNEQNHFQTKQFRRTITVCHLKLKVSNETASKRKQFRRTSTVCHLKLKVSNETVRKENNFVEHLQLSAAFNYIYFSLCANCFFNCFLQDTWIFSNIL